VTPPAVQIAKSTTVLVAGTAQQRVPAGFETTTVLHPDQEAAEVEIRAAVAIT
jgi:hypothetical protein